MKINQETSRKGDRYHCRRRGKRGVIAACALLLAWASAPLAADITFTRSMETRQVEPSSFVLTCTLEYNGVDSRHRYAVSLYSTAPGIGFPFPANGVTYPYGGEVGPDQRTFIIDEPGVTQFRAVLKGNRLSIERIVYVTVPVPENLIPGTRLSCEGGTLDLTTGVSLPAVQMTDVFFDQWVLPH